MEQKYRYKDRVQENWKTSTVTREQQGELYDRDKVRKPGWNHRRSI